jgi:sulfur carrier protein
MSRSATEHAAVSSQQSADSIKLIVNGETITSPSGATVRDLIQQLGLKPDLVAVEINRELVRKATFAERHLSSADRVEILEFVGGG